jgi:cyclopropane fatty-acyl-phospholipid synthase-like methyltransferase
MRLAYSEACERNKRPILAILTEAFAARARVLEIGSGTGQHAVHFALGMPWLVWQPSEMPESMPALRKRIFNEGPSNLRAPVVIDVTTTPWDVRKVDGVFTANTFHIMSRREVEAFFTGLPEVAKPGSVLAVYGPFRYGGRYTSSSNEDFDRMLHARDPESGIRDFEDVDALARAAGFDLKADHAMPANNQTLVWAMDAAAARGPASAP